MDDGSESVQSFFSDDCKIEPVLKRRQSDFDSIMSEVELMEEIKIQRAEIIFNKIFSSETVSNEDPSGFLHIEDKPMRVKVSTFLYSLQQPTKKIDLAVYTNLLHEIKIPRHLVSNTHAKKVLKKVYSDKEKQEETEQSQGESKRQQRSEQSSGSQSKASGSKPAEPKNQKIKQIKRQSRRRKEKNGLTIKDVKLPDRLYSKGQASFGSSKRLQDLSKIPMTIIKMYLENKTILHKILCSAVEFSAIKSNRQRSE